MKRLFVPLGIVAAAGLLAASLTGCGTTSQIGPVSATAAFGLNGKPVDVSIGYATNGAVTVAGSVDGNGGSVTIPTK